MRLRLTALMISLVLLCGCSGGRQDREWIESLREEICAAREVSFHAQIETDDGLASERFVFECVGNASELTLRLLSPELIGGVTAHFSGADASLSYEGLSFEVGPVDANGLCAVRAPEIVLSALGKGVVTQIRKEKLEDAETVAFRVLSMSGYETDVWIDALTRAPLRAEILSENRVAVRCVISDWHMEEG